MEDKIRFGNYLTERRKIMGLSQVQLGALLGVSDKAVSKWENARAMPDSRILVRLGELLGVTTDDLLTARQREETVSLAGVTVREKEARANCRKRMEDLFGPEPPLEAVSRFLAEDQLLRFDTGFSGLPDRLFLLGKTEGLFKRLREKGQYASLFAPTGADWLAYLLSASDVDPLPPHMLCPSCHHVDFVRSFDGNRVHCGWDLPETVCPKCGKPMLRDGHDLSVGAGSAMYRALADIRVMLPRNMRCEAAESLKETLADCLWAEFDQTKESVEPTVRIVILPEEARFLLPPGWESRRPEDRILSTEKDFARFRAYPLIYLANNDSMERLQRLRDSTGIPAERVPFSAQEVLEALLEGGPETDALKFFSLPLVRQEMKKAKPQTWADLISFAGLMHGTGTWFENGEERAAAGEPISFLVSFREDVYETVREKLMKGGITDDGLARDVMENARRGRYAKSGMDNGTKRLLLELGLDEAFIRSISRTKYLFPKICAIRQIRWEATLMWYRLHTPEAFEKTMRYN